MQFRIEFDFDINPFLYREFSLFLYNKMKKSVKKLADRRKYQVREKSVINCSLIKWKRVPSSLDLYSYVTSCLELVKDQGVYIIKVNDRDRVPGSFTSKKLLIRILEYGTTKVRPYPVIRRVFRYYSSNYLNMFTEFMKESF